MAGQTNLPDAPKNGANKLLLSEAVADSSAIVFDGITTHRNIVSGCVETWAPWLYGTRPSNARFYGASFAIEGGEVLAAYFLAKSPHKILRVAGHLLIDQDTFSHIHGAAHNLESGCSTGADDLSRPINSPVIVSAQ
jgi:hypothetical protein